MDSSDPEACCQFCINITEYKERITFISEYSEDDTEDLDISTQNLDEGPDKDALLLSDLFHGECETCPPSESCDRLCVACQHLNLGHLIFCLRFDDLKLDYEVALGPLHSIDKVQNCAFHRVLQSAILSQWGTKDPDCEYTLRMIRSDTWTLSVYPGHPHFYGRKTNISIFSSSTSDAQHQLDAWISRVSAQETINWDRVKSWIAPCIDGADGHSGCQGSDAATSIILPKQFRVVDVQERRLVHPDSEVRFVALSYVWGNAAVERQLVTERENFEILQEKDSLVVESMPRTIEDAIQVCRQLGERYLWVDRLCIIQDDNDDKREQIKSMSAIYTKAVFTLVVACGDNMDVQIPGVGSPRQAPTRVCKIGTARILNQHYDMRDLLNLSTWSTRGWTFQEQVLSPRKLYVTNFQLGWSCQNGLIREENTREAASMNSLDEQGSTGSGLDSLFEPLERYRISAGTGLFEPYTRHSHTYNRLDLSHKDDIYSAFSGILAALYPADEAFAGNIYGLPLRDIDVALLWYADSLSGGVPRISEKAYLPSWSWSSVSGGLNYLSFCGSLVKWTMISAQDSTRYREVKANQTPSYIPYDNFPPWIVNEWSEWSECSFDGHFPPCLYMVLASSQGCLDLQIPNDRGRFIKETPLEELFKTSALRWPSYSSYWESTFGPSAPTSMDPDFLDDERVLLQTRAQTAVVRLISHPEHQLYSYEDCSYEDGFHIISLSGEIIGIAPVSRILNGFVNPETTDDSPSQDSEDQSTAPTIKIMALSISTTQNDLDCCVADEYIPEDSSGITKLYEYTTYQDSTGAWWDPIPVVNVMLIKERDGYWYRVGIGRVLMRRWVELERKSETITLC